MRKISSVLSIILAVCLSIGGVSAAWVYAAGPIADVLKEIGASMGEWDFGYTVSFINNGELLLKDNPDYKDKNPIHWQPGTELVIMKSTGKGITNVINDVAYAAAEEATQEMGSGYIFSHWINAGSTRIDSISADNTEDIILYPSFVGNYTAIFVDKVGEIVAWDTFTTSDYSNILDMGIESRNSSEYVTPPKVEDFEFQYWQVQPDKNSDDTVKLEEFDFSKATGDITIYPVYLYNGDVTISPLDTDGDGKPNEYHVSGYRNPSGTDLVEIPDYIDGVPVTAIEANAFSSYDGVHAIVIPRKIKTVGGNALAVTWGFLQSGETIDIYFAGSYSEWLLVEPSFDKDWESGISSSSHIFFLNGGDKVDVKEGYLQANVSGVFNKSVSWTYKSKVTQDIISTFYTQCKVTSDHPYHDYDQEAGDIRLDGWRPDYLYWGNADGSGSIAPAS